MGASHHSSSLFWPFASRFVAIVNGDIVVVTVGSGCKAGSWEGGWGTVDLSGSKGCHFGRLACCSVARRGLVAVVVNDVVSLGLGGSGCKGRGLE